MEKGLVLSPLVSQGNQGNIQAVIHEKMPLEDIRFALLFWDKLDVTCYERFAYRDSPGFPNPNAEFDVLVGEGIAFVDRNDVNIDNVTKAPLFVQDIIQLEPFAVLHKHLQNNAEDWSMFQVGQSLVTPEKCATTVSTIELELYQLLNVPSAQTPIHDVLEFKEKRKSELLELRFTLDELVSRVTSAENTEQEANRVKAKLTNDLTNYHRVLNESCSSTVAKSMNQIVTNPINAYPSAIAVIAGVLGGIPSAVATLIGAGALGASVLDFAVSERSVYDKLPQNLHKYAYLSFIEKDMR
jgi:hypothetical protein